MSSAPPTAGTRPLTSDRQPTPFEQATVTLSKQAHIQLVSDARSYKSLHERAVRRAKDIADRHQQELERAAQRETALREELDRALARIRELQQRVFGSKSETTAKQIPLYQALPKSVRRRGQQLGARGHGRTIATGLPARAEVVELDARHCPGCGLPLHVLASSEQSEIIEIEVKAYRRGIHRQRYRPACQCGCLPDIVTAPAPARLIPKGKLGISVWVHVLLDKFLYGRPSHRLLQDLSDHGLDLSAGTLAGGLQVISPLFAPFEPHLQAKLRSEPRWHADETRWEVFADVDGKVGHRWYLWVFQSASVAHYVLDPSRSAEVPLAELAGVPSGVLSCDRYAAYVKMARKQAGITLAFCWAHQRRDFLRLANDHPKLLPWALRWVDRIGKLYQLHQRRAQVKPGGAY